MPSCKGCVSSWRPGAGSVAESVAPEYARFVAAQGRAAQAAMAEGRVAPGIFIGEAEAQKLLPIAARRASGLVRPTRRTEVIWVEGDSEIAVSLDALKLRFGEGLVIVTLTVRTDQTGAAPVLVHFACGSPGRPAGLYAAAQRRPKGPELIVTAWGDALVAFAWQCLIGLVTGVANATGKDQRGNLLVPVEMIATARGLEVLPMARHRFAGSSGLKPATPTRR